MNTTQKTIEQQAQNTALLAGIYGVDSATFEGYQYERGLMFLSRQCTANGHTDAFARELEASPIFWRWFMYQCKLIDTRFLQMQVDLVQQYQLGSQSAKQVLPQAYKAWINNELRHGHILQHAYANFIGEYIDSLAPVANDKRKMKNDK
jgi:hypothetical protein